MEEQRTRGCLTGLTTRLSLARSGQRTMSGGLYVKDSAAGRKGLHGYMAHIGEQCSASLRPGQTLKEACERFWPQLHCAKACGCMAREAGVCEYYTAGECGESSQPFRKLALVHTRWT